MRNSTRQDDGGEVDNLGDGMDVSFDCELNLYSNFEPTLFIEASGCDELIESIQNEYDALIKNGTWKLVDHLVGTKPIGCKWAYKNKYK